MLEDLIAIHTEVMKTTPLEVKRYIFDEIHWSASAICLLGHRGVGKTTVMCQYLLSHYPTPDRGLYLSADNTHVLSTGLFKIAQEYFKFGGEALFIDEVHKYPNWEMELKNIIDTYKKKQIVFSASSLLDLKKSKYDLSRRALYYDLKALSFREFLKFTNTLDLPPCSLEAILKDHVKLAHACTSIPILKHFRDYLRYGAFPFFLEGKEDYLSRLSNVIEKVLYEDISVVYAIKQSTIPLLKKLLFLVATSPGFIPNIERLSSSLGVARSTVYNCLNYLHDAGLFSHVFPHAKGLHRIRKPGKIWMENTNLIYAINGALHFESDIGNIRETFFVNQLSALHQVHLHSQADFIIDGKTVIEVGGKSKDMKQISKHAHSYLALDNIEIGFGQKIPLYLFGLMY